MTLKDASHSRHSSREYNHALSIINSTTQSLHNQQSSLNHHQIRGVIYSSTDTASQSASDSSQQECHCLKQQQVTAMINKIQQVMSF